MKLVVIEGSDGTGTSFHSKVLAEKLCSMGYKARMFHHPRHEQDDDHWSRSLHYALARARIVKNSEDGSVLVADRWCMSTAAIAMTLPCPLRSRLIDLCHLEGHLLPAPLLTILLDAPDDVLDERIRDGRPQDAWEASRELRWIYRTMICPECDIVLDTSHPKDEVQARILELALDVLRA